MHGSMNNWNYATKSRTFVSRLMIYTLVQTREHTTNANIISIGCSYTV